MAAAVATISAARSAVCFWTGFVDVQCPAVKVGSIQRCNGPVAFSVVAHFNESKASGLSRVAIGHDAHAINRPMYLKQGSNCILGGPEAEISYKNIFHFWFLSEVAEQ